MAPETSGIIVIDKPEKISSAKVVSRVKRLLGAGKAGHTGTLDPFATGVMVCCINQATKLARFFISGEKKYDAVLHLGVETDTQDGTGVTTHETERVSFSKEEITSVVKQFEGAIEQVPPVYSALKHKGTPLYKLARMGKPVQKPARPVVISYIRILDIALPLVRFEVLCSAGTYVRTLCADMGKALGCGGHLKSLRRTRSSGFTLEEAVTLPELEKTAATGNKWNHVIGMASALRAMPEVIADKALTKKIRHGIMLTDKDFRLGPLDGDTPFIKVVDDQLRLVAVLEPKHKGRAKAFRYCCVFNG